MMQFKDIHNTSNVYWRLLALIVFSLFAVISFTSWGSEYDYIFTFDQYIPIDPVVMEVKQTNELNGKFLTNESVQNLSDILSWQAPSLHGIRTSSSNDSVVLFVDAKPYVFSKTLKTILLWTPYKKGNHWWKLKKYGQVPFVDSKCEVDACFLTNNKSHIKQADFVMFHYDDGPDWPSERYNHQSYVHAMKERPIARQTWLRNYEQQINLTFNYRSDADVSFWRFNFPAHQEKTRGPYRLRIPLKEKQFSVVWPVSHCLTDSKRDQYVRELSKHIDVHIYGLCGNYTCQKLRWDSCYDMLQKTYKFYVSFENAICQDYITEKVHNPMHYELIPIVLGGGDYARNVPSGSYIDVRDFAHPRDLAQYLTRLASNETAYAGYFQWKQEFGVATRQDRWCVLCQAAHNKSLMRRAHHDYYNWWHQACDNELIPRMRQEAGW